MRNLIEYFTVWPVTVSDYGGWTPGISTVVKGRWEEKQEVFFDQGGQEQVSRAVLYVDADIAINSYVYRGLSASTDPTTLEGAEQVRMTKTIDNLSGTDKLRKVIL